jgi:hypothetical protein
MSMIRLGKTSKMRGYSFGLDARNCITGSKLRKIEGSVCSKCYALKGNFNFPSVRKNKETNLKHLESEYFVNVMTYQLQDMKYFRWFDSGDLPHMEALKKIVHKDKDPIGFDCVSRHQGGKCLSCTACWDKRIKNISYKVH